MHREGGSSLCMPCFDQAAFHQQVGLFLYSVVIEDRALQRTF